MNFLSDNKIGDEINVPLIVSSPYRFDINTESKEMLNYLKSYGYVVVKDVANKEEILKARELFWDWATKLSPSLKKDNFETWTDKYWVGDPSNGILYLINHSEFAWKTRLLPKVKKSFSVIWNDDDLIVSFDAGNTFRPWKKNPEWRTRGGWWHVDQNFKKHKEGMVCIQGFVTYYDATKETGGLCLIPKSHLHFKDVCHRASSSKYGIDYVSINPIEEPLLQKEKGILVCANAGDLVLWDSRTIHCNTPSLIENFNYDRLSDDNDIIRLVSYVCMLPISHASKEVIEKRKEGFKLKKPTSHWPNELIKTELRTDYEEFDISICSKDMLDLVGYRKNKYNCLIL